jgi:hypothetical protein
MDSTTKSIKTYRSITMGAIHSLLLLFVIGMIANLYVEIPSELTGNAVWAWVFVNSAVIVIHILLGTLLLLTAIGSLVLAIVSRRRMAVIPSVFGLLFTLMAYAFGSEFLSAGQTNLSSMLMAVGFLGALVSYALGVYKARTTK